MLYHRDIKWKKYFDIQSLELIKTVKRLSNHLWNHIDNPNKKHEIDLKKLYLIVNEIKRLTKVEPFEVEINDDGEVIKCVIRTNYDENKNISIVFKQDFIVTAWLNDKNDKHYTLRRDKYENSIYCR